MCICAKLGYGSFVRSALPAVVFDECLWWLLSKTQDLFSRKAGLQGEGYRVAAFSIVLLSLRPKLALEHWEDRVASFRMPSHLTIFPACRTSRSIRVSDLP